ncbi:isoaspartyl peptidase/L-asparaginase [Luteococcus japonicus]|uniref:isoaspartyl peptidase/L-asparaginase n=1 Tax=Luteococcus japonicus TaxID=33984 RepID=UPI001B880E51|nr:isoaspartyl peptidase/L-asparaginase [Luteococcus japonicus]
MTTRAKNPVRVARLVMESTPHMLFVGPSDDLGSAAGVELMDAEYFVMPGVASWSAS